jgi:hypothetical protein
MGRPRSSVPSKAVDANARILRFKGYLVAGAIALLLLSVLLILAHNP